MARVRKPQPSLENVFFTSPEQRVMRLLLSEPTTAFTPRVISSKLKGVRGLGGVEGINRILQDLLQLGMVDFVDNHRAVKLRDECTCVQILKTFTAICDLESLKKHLEPISSKGVLFGSRALGKARSDSDYDIFVVAENPEEVNKVASRHPLGRELELVVWTPELYSEIDREDARLASNVGNGIVLWGTTW
jgi:predicted nucleotidyltransferase